MSMSKGQRTRCQGLCVVLACACVVMSDGVAGERLNRETPGLGVPLTAEEVSNMDFTILPDGTGLPPGSGTVAEGRAVYEERCLSCHGVEGVDGANDALAGGHGSLNSSRPVRTAGSYWPYATTLFDYIRRAMPYTAPGTLTHDDVYALTAYILHLNAVDGFVSEQASVDADTLRETRMPNRDGFFSRLTGLQGGEADAAER